MHDLIAFETTARYLSVTRAAEELCLSRSAISNQLRGLERLLGVSLFHRTTRTMRLTDAGLSYLQSITGGLERIATATQDIADAGFTDLLTIQCPPSFAPGWLVPRLDGFLAEYPEIDLRILATPDPVDLLHSSVDIEITRRLGDSAGLVVEPLLEEIIIPLANRAVARRLRGKSPKDALNSVRLIHSDRSPIPWSAWLRLHQVTGVKATRGLRFDRTYTSLQVAADGLGIALESNVFADRAIRTKQLVPLFPNIVETTTRFHYMTFSQSNSKLPKVIRFRDWIIRMAAMDQLSSQP